MKLFIVFPSALEFWMQASSRPDNYCNIFDLKDCGFDRDLLLRSAQDYNLSFPVSCAFPYGMHRNSEEQFILKVLNRKLPERSFIKITENVCVASPELCLLQAAAVLPLCKVVEMGNNLCGQYYYDITAKYGQRKRAPITSLEMIKDFLESVEKIHGLYRTRIAVNNIIPGSFSAYESKIATVTKLPLCHGGFGLRTPKLNDYVKLLQDAARLFGAEECCCDMVWSEDKVIFEYDSNMTHLELGQHYADKRKATALMNSGYKLINATAETFKSFAGYEKLFMLIRKALKIPYRSERLEKYRDKRYMVYKALFRNVDKIF